MLLTHRIKQGFSRIFKRETDPAKAYDTWSAAYDNQPENLMLALDEALTESMLSGLDLEGKIIADIGCGTGRHWQKLMAREPARIFGFDVSAGMLAMLKQKFPRAETVLLKDHVLPGLENNFCDFIISTLTIAHIPKMEKALAEWSRVLKPGGNLLITDYHPMALARGARRTFRYQNHTIAIRNHIHSIDRLTGAARQLGLHTVRFTERKIDETVKPFYDQQQAGALYERFYGTPIIYGLLLTKSDAASSG